MRGETTVSGGPHVDASTSLLSYFYVAKCPLHCTLPAQLTLFVGEADCQYNGFLPSNGSKLCYKCRPRKRKGGGAGGATPSGKRRKVEQPSARTIQREVGKKWNAATRSFV